MLAPLKVDVPLTVVLVIVVFVGAAMYLLPRGYSERKVFGYGCLLSILLFIPACVGVGTVVNFFRYGEFQYEKPDDIGDKHIHLPPSARNIVVHKYYSGHVAKFSVNHDDMMAWLDIIEAKRQHQISPEDEKTFGPSWKQQHEDLQRKWFAGTFGRYGWEYVEGTVMYDGPSARTGAGFDVWYSAETGTAFQIAGYW
jgi:hypothetical protein